MAKDSTKCSLCYPRTIFVDRMREVDLAMNADVNIDCPSAFVESNLATSCVLTNLMDFNFRPLTLKDCKIPEKTLDPKTMYKLIVSFRQNGVLSKET